MKAELDPTTTRQAKVTEKAAQKKQPDQQDVLLKIAAAVELFHTPNDECYARFPVNSHHETWAIRSNGFKRWLRHEFYKSQAKGPQGEALRSALQVLEARAQFDASERPVWVRVAEHEKNIYIDLSNPDWEAIEITPYGWQVVAEAPVCFRRSGSMLPLPYPVRGGSVDELFPFLNVASYKDFMLMVAYLLAAMRPRGPYPIMVLNGEQGAAKSTAARVIRELTDPNTSPLRSAPREERDLMVAAVNSWVLGYDNLSGIPTWLSDAFCRLSNGGGISHRELYTNQDEFILRAMRPIILNGIDSLTERSDLADRALIFNLKQLRDNKRQPEREFWQGFEQARPRILGALLNAVSMGLRNQENVKLLSFPRMADFALWITAAEPALPWDDGSLLAAYTGNRQEAVELSLEADVVAVAVRAFMTEQDTWSGKPSELYEALKEHVPEITRNSRAWPKAPNWLTNRLKRATTFLRVVGIEIEFGHSGDRKITLIRKESQNNVQSDQSDQVLEIQGLSLDASENSSVQSKSGSVQDGNGGEIMDASICGVDDSQKVPSTPKGISHIGSDAMDATDASLDTLMGDMQEIEL
jgi:hypothetical protein